MKESETWNAEIVNELVGASSLLAEILNNTLDISKLEEGKIEFNNNFEEINNAIDVVLNIAKANAEKKGIKLESHYQIGLPPQLEFDKSRLTQVVMNLVGNAIKFTPEKGKITVNTTWLWNCGYNNGNCTTCENSLIRREKPNTEDKSQKVRVHFNHLEKHIHFSRM